MMVDHHLSVDTEAWYFKLIFQCHLHTKVEEIWENDWELLYLYRFIESDFLSKKLEIYLFRGEFFKIVRVDIRFWWLSHLKYGLICLGKIPNIDSHYLGHNLGVVSKYIPQKNYPLEKRKSPCYCNKIIFLSIVAF